MKLSRKPWLAAVLAVTVAGGADVAKACFVRSPQPIDVYKDYVTVDITDQVAVKTYKCVFRNPNNRAVVGGTCFMEVEPGAQIDKMSMEVNGKMVKGEVLDVNEANQVFTDIVRKGGSPALLEFHGNKLITTKLPRIAPRGTVTVNLQYTTVLEKKGNLVRIKVLNTNPKANLTPLKEARVTVNIKSKSPVRGVYSPTHSLRTNEGRDALTVNWSQDQYLPTKPFVMYYSTGVDKQFGVDLLAHREKGEKGHFMATISPTLLASNQAAITSKDIMKKDVVFCVDTSGSMDGEKIEQAKKALIYCLNNLRPGDRFNIVDFSDEARSFSKGGMIDVDEKKTAIKKALRYAKDIEAGGGTAIHQALTRSIRSFGNSNRLKMILFVTDGLPTVGEMDPQQILKNITAKNNQNIRLFAFGAGHNVDAKMLDQLASNNRGESDYILPREDISEKIGRFYDKVDSPIMTDLKVMVEGINPEEIYPRQLPDLFKGRQIIVYGRYDGFGTRTITLTGVVNGERRALTYDVYFPEKEEKDNDFVPRLWAGQKVSHLLGLIRKESDNDGVIKEVVDLSKRFGIVTPYTAYLVEQDVVKLAKGHQIVQVRAQQNRNQQLAKLAANPGFTGDRQPSIVQSLQFKAIDQAGRSGIAEQLAYPATDVSKAGEGKQANDKARQNELKKRMEKMRHIGAKTFYQSEGIWYDSSYDSNKEPARITTLPIGSQSYFELIRNKPEVAKYLALGKVLFNYQGTWYLAADDNDVFKYKGILYRMIKGDWQEQ